MGRKTNNLTKFISKMVDEVTQGQLTSKAAAEKIENYIKESQKPIAKEINNSYDLPFTL